MIIFFLVAYIQFGCTEQSLVNVHHSESVIGYSDFTRFVFVKNQPNQTEHIRFEAIISRNECALAGTIINNETRGEPTVITCQQMWRVDNRITDRRITKKKKKIRIKRKKPARK